MSKRAALFAVLVAFVSGVIISLAIRPPGETNSGRITPQTGSVENRINWRLPLAFNTTLPVLGDNAKYLRDTIVAVSNGAIVFDTYEPGEIVPAFSITDAVRDHKVDVGLTWLGYDQGKIPASVLLGAVPFGMEPMAYMAWWFDGEGYKLAEELYAPQNVHPILCGLTGPETAGWFREPIEKLADLEGLKIRFAGLGGRVLERLGASVTMLPGGEIFQALEKGAIDASEYALPIVDQKLGFNRIAPYNYYPGWHQPATSSHLIINMDAWQRTTPGDQALITAVCTSAVTRNLARSEALQGAVIAGFADIGVHAMSLPEPLLRELESVTNEVMQEEAEKNAMFAKIYAHQSAFRQEYEHWKHLAYLPRNF